jgi:hypothetical protein
MVICGIDPGMTGALAFMDAKSALVSAIVPMPLHDPEPFERRRTKRRVNWWAVSAAIREEAPGLVVLERQRAMPRQGVSSTFALGYQYGALTGILAASGIPFELVEPAVWKRDLDLLGHDKAHSLVRARELLPEIVPLITRQKDHGLAEAALIALWKVRKNGTRRLPAG